MVDGALRPGYACAFSSTVLACSTAGVVPFVPTLMASTPRVSSREAGTFAAGQVIRGRRPWRNQGAVEPVCRECRRCRPGRAAAKGGNGRELRARDHARRNRTGGAARTGAEVVKCPGDGQPRVRADHDHPLDAGNPAQPCRERRGGRGRPRRLTWRALAGTRTCPTPPAGPSARSRPRRWPNRVRSLASCVVMRHHGHGGDEQGEHQAADGAEGGPRVVGEAAGGDQRAGAAGPPGHDPGRGHGEPRARDEQADDDEQRSWTRTPGPARSMEAGWPCTAQKPSSARPASSGTTRQARGGFGVARRATPSGEMCTRRSASRAATAAATGTPIATARMSGRLSVSSAGKNGCADERDARDRGAQQEEDPEPGRHPQDRGRRRFGGGEQGDLLAGRADQAHRREPLLAAGGRQPGRGGDEDQHRGQDGQRHDGQDEVDGARLDSRVGRDVVQALGVHRPVARRCRAPPWRSTSPARCSGVCASCAGVRPTMMTSEFGDGSAASPIVPARWPG